MARNYTMNGPNGGTTSYTSAIVLQGGTAARTAVFDIVLGSNVAPNDYSTIWRLGRYTVAPSGGTTFTPLPTDPGNALASVCTSSATTTCITPSGEPTRITAASSPLTIPLNVRATFRYVASPGAEFYNTLSATNGLALQQTGISTGSAGLATIIWFE